MALIEADDRRFLQAVSGLTYCNPFLPERIDYERAALGAAYRSGEPVWSAGVESPGAPYVNIIKITERAEALIGRLRERLADSAVPTAAELRLYEDGVTYLLYQRYEQQIKAALLAETGAGSAGGGYGFYRQFREDFDYFVAIKARPFPGTRPEQLFANYFQVRRAFQLIFHSVIGRSMPAARLRATAWQSIFTHDMRRYSESLYERMNDLNTLIIGPSGTGKELVARAIGMSGYIRFDARKLAFAGKPADAFHAVNLSALPATLVESELFGHRRGSFTGALQDRHSWLESCPPWGAVLLDEVGDLDATIQVKLLRLLETRSFQAIGDAKLQFFKGRFVAATNRDLAAAVEQGELREDFYYRLCADIIETPSLRETIQESPSVLKELTLYFARELAGDSAEALAEEAHLWIIEELGLDYPWPGNIRELEQCIRSILIRKRYRPLRRPSADSDLIRALRRQPLDSEALMRLHCTVVYAETGSYAAAAERLKLDRRTVKARIDPSLLRRLGAGSR